MDEHETAARFEAERAHLRAVAYRMLGSTSEADDAVQEAWLRLSRSETRSAVDNLAAWLTTVVARVSLDMPAARGRPRSEEPLDPAAPEPIGSAEASLSISSARRRWPTRSASLSLVVLQIVGFLARAASGVRAPRSLRRFVRGDRADRRPFARRGEAAGEPGATPCSRRGGGPRRRARAPARGGRRVPRGHAHRRLRGARRRPRSGRRGPRRRLLPLPTKAPNEVRGARTQGQGGHLSGARRPAARAMLVDGEIGVGRPWRAAPQRLPLRLRRRVRSRASKSSPTRRASACWTSRSSTPDP